jgi:hypothetical protein
MNVRSLCLPVALALASLPVAGQTSISQSPIPKASGTKSSNVKIKLPSTKDYTPPKTAWGDPDLQGEWPAYANIPMQRPASFGTRAFLTDEEFAQRAKTAQKQTEDDNEEFVPASGKVNVTINPPGYWVEHGKPDHQASLIVDPPNGRTPPMTPEGEAYVKSLRGGLGPGSHFP